jgi:hypothetical protein
MPRISADAQNAMADAAADLVDVGSGTAVLEVYDGAGPGSIGAAPSGNLLISFPLPNPAFGDAGTPDGEADANGLPITGTAVASADLTSQGYARIINRNGDVVSDTENIGTSGTDVVLSNIVVTSGGDLDLTGLKMLVGTGSL